MIREEYEATLKAVGATSRMEDWLYQKPKEGEVRPISWGCEMGCQFNFSFAFMLRTTLSRFDMARTNRA